MDRVRRVRPSPGARRARTAPALPALSRRHARPRRLACLRRAIAEIDSSVRNSIATPSNFEEPRMQTPRTAADAQPLRGAIRLLALGVMAVGAVTLVGGLRGIGPQPGPLPGLAEALAGALACSIVGLALGLGSFRARAAARAAEILAALVVAFGAWSRTPDVLALALLGAGILLARHSATLSRLLALVAGASGLLTLLGHLYGIASVSPLPAGPLLWVRAVLQVTAAIGVLFLRPESGLPAALLDRSEAGRELRRLLPPVLILPIVLGWVALAGERAGWYDHAFSTALFASTIALSLCGLGLASYASMRRSAEERRRVRAELAASEARY